MLPAPEADALLQRLGDAKRALRAELHKRIIGQSDTIDLMLVALLARGHALLVGVPGLAKTSLVAALAQSMQLAFSRIQFTPDLMPSDILGGDVLEQDPATGSRHFRFVRGPIFANVLLADEINRTSPKTQAALLQAMQESRVTLGGNTYPLPQPFLVFATQNPIEQQGTYPLPEAQLDRFLLQIVVDYPSASEEQEIATQIPHQMATTNVAQVLSEADLAAYQRLVENILVPPHVAHYAVALTRATRPGEASPAAVQEHVAWGAGPRASQSLLLAARARAALAGRLTVELADVVSLARPVLEHRIVLNFRGQAAGVTTGQLIDGILTRLRDEA